MQRQRKTKDPCKGCYLHKDLCICDSIPLLDLSTKLSLIVHHRELKRTTNTGRLAIKALKNSSMHIRGEDREALDLSGILSNDYDSLFFYPSTEAQELTVDYLKTFKKPIHLIVPDGNWRQASKVHTRHPELAGVPRVMISTPNAAKNHLRAETTEMGMATLQAIAHAMKFIEGEDVFQKLIGVYNAKLSATLKGRGLN